MGARDSDGEEKNAMLAGKELCRKCNVLTKQAIDPSDQALVFRHEQELVGVKLVRTSFEGWVGEKVKSRLWQNLDEELGMC